MKLLASYVTPPFVAALVASATLGCSDDPSTDGTGAGDAGSRNGDSEVDDDEDGTGRPSGMTSADGFPDETTTGVPEGTELTAASGMVITTEGAVVEDLDISGVITIAADNVTVRRVRIIRQSQDDRYGVDTGDHEGTLLEDIEVDGAMLGSGTGSGDIGICCSGYTLRRGNVHGFRSGAHMEQDVVIEDSYFHDNLPFGEIHKTSVASNGGENFVVRHNNFDISAESVSSALSLYGDFSRIRNVVLEDNLFNTSGSYCVYAGSVPDKEYPMAENVEIVANAFGTKYRELCGRYGPAAAYDPDAPGSVWEGNYWFDTGEAIDVDDTKHAP